MFIFIPSTAIPFFYVSPHKVDVHLFVALFIGSFRSNSCFIDNNLIKTKNTPSIGH